MVALGSGRQPVVPSAPGGSLTGRALILFTVLGLLVVALSVPVRNWLTQRAEVASLRSDIASSTEQIELLNSELDRWSDPAFISSEARRRLHDHLNQALVPARFKDFGHCILHFANISSCCSSNQNIRDL